MSAEPQPKIVLIDRDGYQLKTYSRDGAFYLGDIWAEDVVWAFDATQVRKLRDVCNAFLDAHGEKP